MADVAEAAVTNFEQGAIAEGDRRLFRHALGSFSTGVAIVTTLSDAGEKVGLTINSFTSLSLDPPLVLWCLAGGSESAGLFRPSRQFTVNILAKDQRPLGEIFASNSNDRFRDVALAGDPGDAPIIGGCVAWFECRVEDIFEGGDHLIITGRVRRFSCREGAPLLFHKGEYK
jgi:flavin reductase (DIM6/NTAB) family NADH-FMN oxidoreductase RutF